MVDAGKGMEQESGMNVISLSPRHRSKISQPSAYLRKTCNCLAKIQEKPWWVHGTFAVWACVYNGSKQNLFSHSVSLLLSLSLPSAISSPTIVELEKHVFFFCRGASSVPCLKSRLPLEKTAVRSVTRISKFQNESRNTCQVQVWKVATGCCTQVQWSRYYCSGHGTRHHIRLYWDSLGNSSLLDRLRGSEASIYIYISSLSLSFCSCRLYHHQDHHDHLLQLIPLPPKKAYHIGNPAAQGFTSTVHSHLDDSQGGDTAPWPKIRKGVQWIQNELQGNEQNTQPDSETYDAISIYVYIYLYMYKLQVKIEFIFDFLFIDTYHLCWSLSIAISSSLCNSCAFMKSIIWIWPFPHTVACKIYSII